MRIFFVLLITAFFGVLPSQGAIVEQIGSGLDWNVSWKVINSLNDLDDGKGEIDFVGDASNPGAYWADNGTYVFFRVQVAANTDTFGDSHFLLIDVNNYLYGTGFGSDEPYMPDYGFVWDSKSADQAAHGLEMLVISSRDNVWNGINMDDIDGSASKKLSNDINGDIAGRGYDGYIRTESGISTTNFGLTTCIEFAVSWSYLENNTDLERGQVWSVALASIANSTDHNNLTGDIGGGANPSDSNTLGWAPIGVIPEPATAMLLALGGGLTWLIRMKQRW